jgi:RimJ/RimL family protein N-acetyltransferase
MAPAPRLLGARVGDRRGRASLRYGFETLGLDRIISIFTPENPAAGRVMEKLGMHDWLTTTDPKWGTRLLVREIRRLDWDAASQGEGPDRVPVLA